MFTPDVGADKDQVILEFSDEGFGARREHRVDPSYFVAHFPAGFEHHVGKELFLGHNAIANSMEQK